MSTASSNDGPGDDTADHRAPADSGRRVLGDAAGPLRDHPVLVVRQAGCQVLHLLVVDRVTFGRDCDGIILVDSRVSRRHAEFRLADGGGLDVSDMGSSNGTFLNGVALSEADAEVGGGGAVSRSATNRLRHGDVVRVGLTEIEVLLHAEGSGRDPTRATATTMDQTTTSPLGQGRRSSAAGPSSLMKLADEVQSDIESVRGPLVRSVSSEGTVTVVFSDIESSTARATAVGDAQWMRVLERHNEIVRGELQRHGGTEIKSQGDGFMMSFTSARRAVDFAIASQQAIAECRASDPDLGVKIRLGVHTGEAVRKDGDLFGRHVIIASRIADQADGDEILVSALVRELTAGKVDFNFGPARQVDLKGIGEQIVHLVIW